MTGKKKSKPHEPGKQPDSKPEPEPVEEEEKAKESSEATDTMSEETSEKAKEFFARSSEYLKHGAHGAGVAVKKTWSNPLVFTKRLDAVLDWIGRTFPAELFDFLVHVAARAGHVSLFIAFFLTIIFSIVHSFSGGVIRLVGGIAFALALLVAQYTASKLLTAGEALTKSAPTSLSSPGFLQSSALLGQVGALISLAWAIASLFGGNAINFWSGLCLAVTCSALGYIAIHPGLVSLSVDENTAEGEDAIGILSFFVKSGMRIVPVAFGTGATLGTICLLLLTIKEIFGTPERAEIVFAAKFLLGAALLPFATYVVFALYSLLVGLCRSILSLRQD